MYRQVLSQTSSQFSALVEACQVQRVQLDARLRTDMDQIITSKEHVSGKIRGEQRKTGFKQLCTTASSSNIQARKVEMCKKSCCFFNRNMNVHYIT